METMQILNDRIWFQLPVQKENPHFVLFLLKIRGIFNYRVLQSYQNELKFTSFSVDPNATHESVKIIAKYDNKISNVGTATQRKLTNEIYNWLPEIKTHLVTIFSDCYHENI